MSAPGALGLGNAVGLVERPTLDRPDVPGCEAGQIRLGDPEHAPVAGQPEVSFAVVDDLVDLVVEETDPGRVGGGLAIREPHEPAGGAEPQGPVHLLVDREDLPLHALQSHVDRRDLPIHEPGQAAPLGADPELPLLVHVEIPHDLLGQPVGGGEAVHPRLVHPRQAGPRADPEPTGGIVRHGVDLVAGQTVVGGELAPVVAISPEEAVPEGSHPQGSLPVLVQGQHVEPQHPLSAGEGHAASADDAVQSPLGGHPEAAVPVLEHGPDAVSAQPVHGRERGERAVPQPVQAPAEGPDPEVALPVHLQGADPVMAEPLGDPVAGHLPRGGVTQQAPVVGSDPQVAVGVLGERLDGGAPYGLVGHPFRPLVGPAEHTGPRRADPEGAVLGRQQAPHVHVFQIRRGGQANRIVTVEYEQAPVPGADPDLPLGAGLQRGDVVPPQGPLGHGLEPVFHQPQKSRRGPDPQASVPGRREGLDEVEPRALGVAEDPDLPLPVADQPAALGGSPDAPVRVLLQSDEVVDGDLLVVAPVEDLELDAIEAGQPLLGRHPEIAGPVLEDPHHRHLGQTLGATPGLVHVLAGALARIECGCRGGDEQEQRDGREQRETNTDIGSTAPHGPTTPPVLLPLAAPPSWTTGVPASLPLRGCHRTRRVELKPTRAGRSRLELPPSRPSSVYLARGVCGIPPPVVDGS